MTNNKTALENMPDKVYVAGGIAFATPSGVTTEYTRADLTPTIPDDKGDDLSDFFQLLAEMCSDEYKQLAVEEQCDHVLKFIRQYDASRKPDDKSVEEAIHAVEQNIKNYEPFPEDEPKTVDNVPVEILETLINHIRSRHAPSLKDDEPVAYRVEVSTRNYTCDYYFKTLEEAHDGIRRKHLDSGALVTPLYSRPVPKPSPEDCDTCHGVRKSCHYAADLCPDKSKDKNNDK